MRSKTSLEWGHLAVLSLISLCVSFFGFLIYEVIWGDILKDYLEEITDLHPYSIINLILTIGLLFGLGVCTLVNIFIIRSYTLDSRLTANLLTLAATIVIIFVLSFAGMFFLFPNLSAISILGLFPLYFTYFSLYILPTPAWFWILTLIIYHILLILFAKQFYIKKMLKKKKKKGPVYKSRVLK